MPFYPPGSKIPHRSLKWFPTHLIMRLAGSIPQVELSRLHHEREQSLNALYSSPKKDISEFITTGKNRIDGKYHLGVDNALHRQNNGPYFMKDARIASIVLNALLWAAQHNHWYVYAACVMGNHIHAVVRAPDGRDDTPIGPVVQSVKRHTARQANLILDRVGRPFWSSSYFDREVRTGKFNTVIWYVLNNPVKAGLVEHWTDWPHTYLHPDYLDVFGG